MGGRGLGQSRTQAAELAPRVAGAGRFQLTLNLRPGETLSSCDVISRRGRPTVLSGLLSQRVGHISSGAAVDSSRNEYLLANVAIPWRSDQDAITHSHKTLQVRRACTSNYVPRRGDLSVEQKFAVCLHYHMLPTNKKPMADSCLSFTVARADQSTF